MTLELVKHAPNKQDMKALSTALGKVTAQCRLPEISATEELRDYGRGEEALVKYWSKAENLKELRRRVTTWATRCHRKDAELAICRSLWQSYTFYINRLTEMYLDSEFHIIETPARQGALFNIKTIRQGAKRYVQSYQI